TCGKAHTQHRCFSHLDDAWCAEFGDEVECPHWAELLRSGVAIFDLDYDVILSNMYALSASAEGDCYRCVPPDPGIEAAALGAGSSLDILATDPPQVAASAQVSASGQVATSCSCGLLSHQSLLWHHSLGNPSLPRLRGMHSRLLVSGLPRSLPPLPPSPAPPCLSCVEGRQRATPHSSSLPPRIAPLQTLHMDMRGQARVSGQSRERYFVLVVDDYTRYTTVFPLRSKGQVVDVLIPWIRAVRLQLRERFHQDLPILGLHSDRDVRWTGEVGDASVFRVWGSRAFVRDTSADKLFARAIPCIFLGFVPDAPGWQFYHPTSHRVFPSQDVTFDESVPFYHLFPYRSAPPPPPPLFLAPGPPPVDPLPPQGPAPSGVSQVDPLRGSAPYEVAVGSGAARGAVSGGAVSWGEEPVGEESVGAGSGGADLGGEEPGGAKLEGVEPGDAEDCLRISCVSGSFGEHAFGVELPELEALETLEVEVLELLLEMVVLEVLRLLVLEVLVARGSGTGGAGAGGAESGGTGAGGAGAGGAGVGGAGVGGTGAGGAGAGGAGAVDPGGHVRPRPYFVPLLQQVLGVPSSTSLTPPLLSPPPDQSQPPLLSASPLPAPSPYTEQSDGLTERREPASCPVSCVCTARRVPRSRPPPIPGTHTMALRLSSVPLGVPLPALPESSFHEVPDPESDRAHAANPTVSLLLATADTDPSYESAAASALVAELLEFAAACHLDYATALVAESEYASPPSVRGECAFGTDVLEDRKEDFECLAAALPRFASMLLAPKGDPDALDIRTPHYYAEAITGPYSSQWQAAMDAKMASWKSIGTYVDEVPPPGANIVDGIWIFRVKRPPGSPPAFKARYVARGFNQRQGVSLHEEIWLCRPPGFTGSFPVGNLWSLRRPVNGFRQAPCEWHDTLRTTLAALRFAPSTADLSLFLRTDTSLPLFYVLVYIDDLVFAIADTEALTLGKSELQKRHTCTDLGELRNYLCLPITRDRARRTITLTQSHMVHQVLQRFGFQFSSPQPTPISTGHSLSAPPSDESVEPSGLYLLGANSHCTTSCRLFVRVCVCECIWV
ncbi:unnamed protein product, partial [Closterium sp. NIES-53]